MGITTASEYPAILPPSLKKMTLGELKQICVDDFPSSKTRKNLFDQLVIIIKELNNKTIKGDIWIDGSFLTQKIDPNDIDILLYISNDFYENAGKEQKEIINWVNRNLRNSHKCHSYVSVIRQKDDPQYWLGQYMHAYWMRQFGFDRENQMKGIAVIEL